LTVGANKGTPARKSWAESLAGFAMFAADKDDVRYFCHTSLTPRGTRDGIIFRELTDELRIARSKMVYSPQDTLYIGIDDAQMATMYQAADVFLLSSRAEGFGFPVAEAQLCGTPVITIEAHALDELTINGVKCVRNNRQWMPHLQYWWHVPDPVEIAEKLEYYYRNRGRETLAELSEAGRQRFVEDYSHEAVWAQHWKPFIEQVEAELW